MERKKKFLSIFVLLLSLSVLSVGGYQIMHALQDVPNANVPVIKQDAHYSIRTNATDFQAELYSKLTKAIDNGGSDHDLAALVAQNFIADLFTFTNKLRINDIGGLQFVDASIRVNVYQQFKNSISMGLLPYFENNTIKDTLEVDAIQVNGVETIDFEVITEEKDDDGEPIMVTREAVAVSLSWSFVPSTLFDVTTYPTEARLVLLKAESGFYYVAEVDYETEA